MMMSWKQILLLLISIDKTRQAQKITYRSLLAVVIENEISHRLCSNNICLEGASTLCF